MKLNREEHQKKMLAILSGISDDPVLSINLGFKGGTCLYFFYGLDRFSVDLDFDLLNVDRSEEIIERIVSLLSGYGEVKKENPLKIRLKYSEDSAALKVDISDRRDINKLNTYEVKDIVSGVPLRALKKEDIFAHKLVAVYDRYGDKTKNKVLAHRDLYDLNFFFEKEWKYNQEIIKLRSGKNVPDYLKSLKELIEKRVEERKILEGIGALINEDKRRWVRKNLKKEIIKKLDIEIKVKERNNI